MSGSAGSEKRRRERMRCAGSGDGRRGSIKQTRTGELNPLNEVVTVIIHDSS